MNFLDQFQETTGQQFQDEFYNSVNAANRRRQQPEEGRQYIHVYDDSIKIQLISPTRNGWKVTQWDSKSPSGNRLRTPKRKTAYFSDSEIKDLFKPL